MRRSSLSRAILAALLGTICSTANATASLVSSSFLIVSDQTDDGRLDAGEGVAVVFCVRNPDTIPTPRLLGTLLPTGGVTSPSGPNDFGSFAAGEEVCRTFAFRVGPTCGAAVTASLQLTGDIGPGVPYLATVEALLPSGMRLLRQAFDDTTPPALPAGWTTTAAGMTTGWTTQPSPPWDTAPVRAYAPNPAAVSDASLVSPSIALPAGVAAYLAFRNYPQTFSGWDGGVLEVAVAGGAFQDILDAGGTFLSGGYNGVLADPMSGNPLGGRAAWTGTTGGYITTQVRLPDAAAGQSIRLRWRLGTDASQGQVGWSIDSVLVSEGSCVAVPTDAPWGLRAEVRGRDVTFRWQAPSTATPFGYRLDVSLDGGATFPLAFPTGATTAFSASGPEGVFVVRVAALFAGNVWTTSTPAVAALGSVTRPGRPRNLLAAVDGQHVQLAWSLDEPGGTATAVVLEAGSAPGLTDILSFPLPVGTTGIGFDGAPPGLYYVRLRQAGPSQSSAASGEVVLHVAGTCTVPAAPLLFTGMKTGGVLSLSWALGPVGSAAPAWWLLEAGNGYGLANLATLPLAVPRLVVSPPPGTYYLRVRAVNACGTSRETADLVFTVP